LVEAIQTEGLTKVYGPTTALDDFTMRVPSGIVFGFLGPNGAGKTTTIRLLLGLVEPTSGDAAVLGYDVRKEPHMIRGLSGALLEHNGLYERLSAEDNLEFYGRVWRMPRSDRRTRIRELMEHMGLWERRGDIVASWSRGMKQKLAISRALLHGPELVFMDEPTAGLDPIAAVSLRRDLTSLVKKESVTVFLTTHNLDEAEKICDEVAVINRGRLVAKGSVEELRRMKGADRLIVKGRNFGDDLLSRLREREEVSDLYLKDSTLVMELRGKPDVSGLVNMIIGSGSRVEEVRRDSASLEEVFLGLMEDDRC